MQDKDFHSKQFQETQELKNNELQKSNAIQTKKLFKVYKAFWIRKKTLSQQKKI